MSSEEIILLWNTINIMDELVKNKSSHTTTSKNMLNESRDLINTRLDEIRKQKLEYMKYPSPSDLLIGKPLSGSAKNMLQKNGSPIA